jgi:hypothetical protein
MSEGRPWYREPETFIALAALVVSLTAVAVGIYEAWLQRAHDRAEVWPRLEVGTWTSDSGATLRIDNTGLGPALVDYIAVTVDGRPAHDWPSVIKSLYGDQVSSFGHSTVFEHALRPGDQHAFVHIPAKSVPANFWDAIARLTVTVCYSSVFHEHWIVVDKPGQSNKWSDAAECPRQPAGTDL